MNKTGYRESKQLKEGTKVWHENERKYTEGKREARNGGMTGKSGKREILWEKIRKRKK
jgi:hypothetical protein